MLPVTFPLFFETNAGPAKTSVERVKPRGIVVDPPFFNLFHLDEN